MIQEMCVREHWLLGRLPSKSKEVRVDKCGWIEEGASIPTKMTLRCRVAGS